MSQNPLTMTRPLAMRLLHEAQITEDEVSGLVTAGEHADYYFPGELTSALQRAQGAGRKPWAVFAYRQNVFAAPAAEAFKTQPDLLRITACLETKGVLQLRVYRCAAGTVEECPLRIID